MLFKKLKSTEIIIIILVFLSILNQIIFYYIQNIYYFYVSSAFIGLGFIVFGIFHATRTTKVKVRKNFSSQNNFIFRFFINLTVVLSIVGGISIAVGDNLYFFGRILGNFEMVIGGRIIKGLYIIAFVTISSISMILTFKCKSMTEQKLLPVIIEIILMINLVVLLIVDIRSMFYYQCYIIFKLPSCFPELFYFFSSLFYLVLSFLLYKLTQIIYTIECDSSFNSSESNNPVAK